VATILVADDNSNIQKMVALALKDQGIEVVAVGNGEAAVRKLPQIALDLVLADIFMPVRSGYEVCEFIKQDPRYAHIPVILLVGAFDPLDEREAQRVGADGVVKKPFVPPEPLISLVKAVLDRTTAARLVPVGASSRLAALSQATPAAETASAPVPEPAAELAEEQFATHSQRVEFAEGEKPLAFGALLDSPSIKTVPEREASGPLDTGFAEIHAWRSPPIVEEPLSDQEAPVWGGTGSALPRGDDATSLRSVEETAEPANHSVVEERSPAVSQEASSEAVVPFQSGAFVEDAAVDFKQFLGVVPAPVEPSAAPHSAVVESTANEVERTPGATLDWPAAHLDSGAGEPRAVTDFGVPSWLNTPAPPEPPPEAVPEAEPEAPAIRSAPVESFPVPRPADPAVVEAVVAQVIEHVQPQILEIVTREILKPVVEALVRRELERQ